MESLEGFFSYDELLVEPLARRGWAVSFVPWRSGSDWSEYAVVLIRTPWDYYHHAAEFLAVLETISGTSRLENPLDVVRWNIDKRYLLDLQSRGVPIVPTALINNGIVEAGLQRIESWDETEIILKPAISANATNTHRRPRNDHEALEQICRTGNWLVQPFIESVIAEGEVSLFYFGGELSHAIRKTPKAGDYRVQEEHGGILESISADEPIRQAGRKVMDAIGQDLLYARVDLVRHEDRWLLMELELIEPSLYFNMDPASPERFAAVFAMWLR